MRLKLKLPHEFISKSLHLVLLHPIKTAPQKTEVTLSDNRINHNSSSGLKDAVSP